jgi:hypothetical protein
MRRRGHFLRRASRRRAWIERWSVAEGMISEAPDSALRLGRALRSSARGSATLLRRATSSRRCRRGQCSCFRPEQANLAALDELQLPSDLHEDVWSRAAGRPPCRKGGMNERDGHARPQWTRLHGDNSEDNTTIATASEGIGRAGANRRRRWY